MKKQFLIFLLLLSFVGSVSAQIKEAQKIGEFDAVGCDDLRQRLDLLAMEVNKLPKSKGYNIVYEGKNIKYKLDRNGNMRPTKETILPVFAQSAINTQLMMRHLLGFRNLPKESFLFISGGYRELYTVELWLVPDGTILKPMPNLTKMNYRKGKPIDICEGIG